MITANIFDIKRFSINDGDGIRTTLSAAVRLVPESGRDFAGDSRLVRKEHLRGVPRVRRRLQRKRDRLGRAGRGYRPERLHALRRLRQSLPHGSHAL